MGAPPASKNYAVPSIQTVYNLYYDIDRAYRERVPTLYCKNVIKIPIAEPVARKIGTNTYTVTPYTALVIENVSEETLGGIKIVIETNEGITVEPIVVHSPLVQYSTAYLLTLPRGTTGIKKAYVGVRDYRIVQNDLIFDVMDAPYNYENYLFSVLDVKLTGGLSQLFNKVNNLEGRVTALENKAGS